MRSDSVNVVRFYAKTRRDGKHLLWAGSVHPKMGYGLFWFKGRSQYAHRVAWQLENGDIPDGLHVLHECDIPACVEIDCLFLGTEADNAHDRDRKGRHVPLRGVANGRAVMSEEKVLSLRKEYSQGARQVDLAFDYGISQGTVSQIVRRVTWKDI